MTTFRHTRVEIDATDHTTVFPCTVPVPEERWNGFACPSFDRATAEQVITMATADGQDEYNRFLWTTDRDGVACLLHGSADSDEVWWEYVGNDRDGYPIGACYWTWQELDADAPTDDSELDAWLADRTARASAYADAWNGALNEAYARGADRTGAYAAASGCRRRCRPVMTLTVEDIDRATHDERWLGFGYLGEREVTLSSTDPELPPQPDLVARTDQAIIDHANAQGWTYDDLFHWCNSKPGRWLGDVVFGGSDSFEERWARVLRQDLLAKVEDGS